MGSWQSALVILAAFARCCSSASPDLRRIIADRAAQRLSDPKLRGYLLALSEDDDDAETQSIATVGLCNEQARGFTESATVRRSVLNAFTADRESERDSMASLSGLLALGHLETVLSVMKKRATGFAKTGLGVVSLHDSAATATALLAQHWGAVESTLGKRVSALIAGGLPFDSLFWVRFAPHVSRSPALRKYFLRHCERQPWIGVAEITALAQLPSERDLLLDACCRTVTTPRPSWSNPYSKHAGKAEHARALATAARVLASKFAHSERALTALERAVGLCSKWRNLYIDIPFIGLAAGWPEHPLVLQRAEVLRASYSASLLADPYGSPAPTLT